jgi:integrase/recombinase XerC
MLQAGLRVGEVAALHVSDVSPHERSGVVRISHGKGLKAREVPLNATVRRALKHALDEHQMPGPYRCVRSNLRQTLDGRSGKRLTHSPPGPDRSLQS